MTRPDPLAAHIRRLGNHDLNELLVQLPKPTFAALANVALARPVLPAGLLVRYEPARGVDGWTVVACAPRRGLGIITRDRDPGGQLVWRAWTRAGDPVQVADIGWWRRRADATGGRRLAVALVGAGSVRQPEPPVTRCDAPRRGVGSACATAVAADLLPGAGDPGTPKAGEGL